MSSRQRILMAILLGCTVFVFGGRRADAAVRFTGESHSPASYRVLCSSGTPVDFAAYPSNVKLNATTGTMTYNINVRWQRCSGGANTRAYAVYAGPEVCPLAGYYGAGSVGNAQDCVKYIGSPAYTGPGNGLRCPGGADAQCVTPVFSGARRAANQPSVNGESISIPMSYTIPLWAFTQNNRGNWTISNRMCQYYKTGANFSTHNDNRCMDVRIAVSWEHDSTPPTITCGTVTTSPRVPQPGESFTLTATFSTNGGSRGVSNDPTMYSIQVVLSAAGINAPGRYAAAYAEIPWNSGSGVGTLPSVFSPDAIRIPTPGTHEVRYEVVVNGAANSPIECVDEVRVANTPYFKVYGGDVQAGAAILETDGTCTKEPSARIIGWHTKDTGTGAGTQLAAFALGAIDGFASGQQRNSGAPKNLTFANNGSGVPDSDYGGGWAESNALCAADYLSAVPASAPNSYEVAPGGELVLTAGAADRHRTIYVNGDALISNNIIYADGAISDPHDYPSFRLIATGDIYVDPDVTILNGLFVSGGSFYTCSADNSASKPTNSDLNNKCQAKSLTVYGAVIAETIKLARTGGTLSEADTTERWHAGGKPAEKFIYSPLIWLTSDSSAGGAADSYRTLPPVL